jgi:hypothetical protein
MFRFHDVTSKAQHVPYAVVELSSFTFLKNKKWLKSVIPYPKTPSYTRYTLAESLPHLFGLSILPIFGPAIVAFTI